MTLCYKMFYRFVIYVLKTTKLDFTITQSDLKSDLWSSKTSVTKGRHKKILGCKGVQKQVRNFQGCKIMVWGQCWHSDVFADGELILELDWITFFLLFF